MTKSTKKTDMGGQLSILGAASGSSRWTTSGGGAPKLTPLGDCFIRCAEEKKRDLERLITEHKS